MMDWNWGLLGAGIVIGTVIGLVWTKQWITRYRYDSEHWNSVIKSKDKLYQDEHQLVKALRSELTQMHSTVTKLTIKNVEALSWLSRVKDDAVKDTTGSEKSPESSPKD